MNAQVIEILDALPKKELKAVGDYINSQKREKLKELYKYLITHTNKTNQPSFKEKLFQSVFDMKHSSKKDYLLRNELRLLNQAIKHAIIKEEVNQSSYKDLVYLKALKRLKLEPLFVKETERFQKDKTEMSDYAALSEFNATFLRDISLETKYTIKDKVQLKTNLKQAIETEKKAFVHKLRALEVLLAHSERVLATLKNQKEFTSSETNISLNDEMINDANSMAKYWTAESYRSFNEEAILALENTIGYLEGSSGRNPNINMEISVLKARIGLEYLLIGNYHNSKKYFEASLEYKTDLPENRLVPICINYISVLCKLEEYELALNVYETYPEILAMNVQSERVLGQYITLLILCNQIENAANAFPKNLKDGEKDIYQYFRLLLSIVFVERGDVDLALNEINNLLRHIKIATSGLIGGDKEIVEFVKDYIEIQVETRSIQKEKREKSLVRLNKELMVFKVKYNKFQSESLIIKWLENKIAQ